MADHADFLAAIIAQPDEDAPRLIYADWLEEQGNCERAEFIRLQCELATLSYRERRWQELAPRAKALLDRNEREWIHGSRTMVQRWTFARGFVERVELCHHAPAIDWPRLFHLFPLQFVRMNVAIGLVQELCSQPEAARLRGLNLWYVPLRRAGLQAIVHSPFLIDMRHLSLRESQLTAAAMKDLAWMSCLDRLETLKLSFNELHDAGVCSLLDTGRLKKIKNLHLRRCQLTTLSAEALLAAQLSDSLEELHLEENLLSAPWASRLRERFGTRVYL